MPSDAILRCGFLLRQTAAAHHGVELLAATLCSLRHAWALVNGANSMHNHTMPYVRSVTVASPVGLVVCVFEFVLSDVSAPLGHTDD